MTSGKPGRRASGSSRARRSGGDCWPLNLKAPWLVPMAQASESQPVRLTKSSASAGIGQAGVAFLDLDVLLDAAEHAEFGLDGRCPWRAPRSTTRLVISTFLSNGSCEASIITEL